MHVLVMLFYIKYLYSQDFYPEVIRLVWLNELVKIFNRFFFTCTCMHCMPLYPMLQESLNSMWGCCCSYSELCGVAAAQSSSPYRLPDEEETQHHSDPVLPTPLHSCEPETSATMTSSTSSQQHTEQHSQQDCLRARVIIIGLQQCSLKVPVCF